MIDTTCLKIYLLLSNCIESSLILNENVIIGNIFMGMIQSQFTVKLLLLMAKLDNKTVFMVSLNLKSTMTS